MVLRFRSLDDQEPGTLYRLLCRSYADLIKSDPIHWEPEESNWHRFDRDAFENPGTIGSCVFLSWHVGALVGFASFDPRQAPEIGVIGHNCILPRFRGRGFGRQQVNEILDRFMDLGVRTAMVTTGDSPFFLPARRMYQSCGFQEISREPWEGDKTEYIINYRKKIV